MTKSLGLALSVVLLGGSALAQSGKTRPSFPDLSLSNGEIRAKFYLPDPVRGYYRATRFDWSGVVASLEYQGHNFFGPWFDHYDPKIHDSISGPVEEFRAGNVPLGYAEAKAGGTFIRIGVGVLRKPEERHFDDFKTYDIVDPGRWTVRHGSDWVEFVHVLSDSYGYAYVYKKTIRLVKGKPQMVLEHSLRNTGRRPIDTNVYDHNFLVLDNQPTGPAFTVSFPFAVHAVRDLKGLAEVKGNRILFPRELEPGESVLTNLTGFGDSSKDYDITVENKQQRAGMHVIGDRPLSDIMFWSIRTTVCAEPYIEMHIGPGQESKWRIVYAFYTFSPLRAN
jgi:hypothetical protein